MWINKTGTAFGSWQMNFILQSCYDLILSFIVLPLAFR